MFLSPAGLAYVGGLLGYGLLLLRRSSKLRIIGATISAVMLVGIGMKLPGYFRESARAAQLCSN